MSRDRWQGTTVLAVRRDGHGAMGGDGQVTQNNQWIVKGTARKVRRIFRGQVLVGFAGAVADAFALLERLEDRLEQHHGQLDRAAIELAKEWRTDRVLRRLEALLVAMDRERLLLISGSGEIIEPDDGVVAIGSGGPYALAAARALLAHTSLPARTIVEHSLRIAADICVFTNHNLTVEEV
ncbi:MAG TPA: ATP-dependent protease subunit HslV [Firmicutes bacterium]|nr:ATP-dependent protease subunit HslV [Bacillota bacterium]